MARKRNAVIMDFQQKMSGGVKKLIPMNVQKSTRLPVCTAMSSIRECSLAELRQLQEFLSLELANRVSLRPLVGDTVHFSDGQDYFTGVVTRINRKSVSVVLEGSNDQMRVAYADIQKPKAYMTMATRKAV